LSKHEFCDTDELQVYLENEGILGNSLVFEGYKFTLDVISSLSWVYTSEENLMILDIKLLNNHRFLLDCYESMD